MNKATIGNCLVALIFLLWIIFLPAGCNGNSADGGNINKYHRDTSKAVIMTLGYGLRDVVGPTVAYKVNLDTLMWVEKDTAHAEKKWNNMSYYVVFLNAMTNKEIAAKYGVPEFDSTGKHYPIIIRDNYSPTIVKDSIYNYDSAFVQLQRLIPKPDSIIRKQ